MSTRNEREAAISVFLRPPPSLRVAALRGRRSSFTSTNVATPMRNPPVAAATAAGNETSRRGAEVESRLMEQWFFRITDYAQALLDDLDTVDWPESIKARQRGWIGHEGAECNALIRGRARRPGTS